VVRHSHYNPYSNNGTTFSVGYDKQDFDFECDDFDDLYPDLESFQTALENSRKSNDYFSNATLLMFALSPFVQYSIYEYESWGKLYEEAIECYKKSERNIHSAEAMLEYCTYKDDPETKLEQNQYSELLLSALAIFENEDQKDGIFRVTKLMCFDFLSYELEKLEKKYGVEFSNIYYFESLNWKHLLSKLSIIPILIVFFVMVMGEPTIILIVVLGAISIILIVVDIVQLRKGKETMMRPYTRFFEWIEE
jgi:hypothetical protein